MHLSEAHTPAEGCDARGRVVRKKSERASSYYTCVVDKWTFRIYREESDYCYNVVDMTW